MPLSRARMGRPSPLWLVSALVLLLSACASRPPQGQPPHTIELSIFSLNDFHGHIQSQQPTPLSPRLPDAKTGELRPQAAGGAAYLATALQGLRAQRQHHVFVAAGDLLGASPQVSSLLKDEPTLSALSAMGLVATALGNHDLDAGLPELQRKLRGECAPSGCAWNEFKGASFPYLAANMRDAVTGQRILPSHVTTEIAGLRVAFAGAVTRDTPKVIMPRNIQGLRFDDEADSLNALVPELRASGAQVLVAIMHEGAIQDGGPNDASYTCPGIRGRALDIAQRLDPAYALIISGHTHQAYTCKVNARLLVQAGSFGGWITESRLLLDASGQVLDAQATNHPVLQSTHAPNPAFAALVQRAAALTEQARNRPIATLTQGASRMVQAPYADSPLGNLVADAHLAYARARGGADLAMTNSGGIRADLTVQPGRAVTHSDLSAIQPFNNDLIALTLSGAQLQELVRRQLPKRPGAATLQVSHNVRYTWSQQGNAAATLETLTVDGQPIQAQRDYRIVVNTFMAEGGNDLNLFKQGRDRVSLGLDLEAFEEWLQTNPKAMEQIESGRITRR